MLIINLWTNEIGRFTASNYEIIKIIFEINLRYFNQESVKHLLFVIRDWDDRQNFDAIKKIISDDIVKLWHEIKKPKQFENVKPEEFFELQFFQVHNFIYEKSKFDTDCTELATRFRQPQHPNFLFKPIDITKNIPFDGLYMFAERVWETIKENKELNLPSQKIIVSNFRCGEIKRESLDKSNKELERIRFSVSNNKHSDLKKELEDVLNKSVREFKESTEQYDDQIVKDIETQLRRETLLQFDEITNIQKDKIEGETIKFLKDEIAKYKGVNDISALMTTLKNLKAEVMQYFTNGLKKGTTDTDEQISKQVDKLQEKVDSIISEMITAKINTLLKNLQNQKLKEIELSLNRIFSELKPTFWEDFLKLFRSTFDNYSEEILSLRSDTDELKNTVSDEMFDAMKLELFYTIRNHVQIKFKNLTNLVLDRFRRMFENTDSGMRRNWKVIEEADINVLFGHAKKECMELLESTKDLNFPHLLTGRPISHRERDHLDQQRRDISHQESSRGRDEHHRRASI